MVWLDVVYFMLVDGVWLDPNGLVVGVDVLVRDAVGVVLVCIYLWCF